MHERKFDERCDSGQIHLHTEVRKVSNSPDRCRESFKARFCEPLFIRVCSFFSIAGKKEKSRSDSIFDSSFGEDGCFKKAVNNRMITFNPVPLAEIPKCKEKKEKYVFTKEEQNQLMEYIKKSYLYDFFRVTIMTGMRNGETRALRWCDIDFEKKLISVNHTLVWVTGEGHMLDTPKTRASKRKIPMLSQVYDILSVKKKQADSMGTGNEDNFVFCLPDGFELSRSRIEIQLEITEKHMLEEGIPVGHFTCHTLRHAFATRAIENVMKPQVLKTILGHSNISMTMDLYAHVLGDEKAQEMLLMEDLSLGNVAI